MARVSVFCHAADLGFVKPPRSFSSDFLAGKRATDKADGQAGTSGQIRQELGALWLAITLIGGTLIAAPLPALAAELSAPVAALYSTVSIFRLRRNP